MQRTLFAISDDLQALADLLDEMGGDITDADVETAITAWFAELQEDMQTKLDNYAALIREFTQRAAVRKQEAQRLLARAKADDLHARRLHERLTEFFQRHQLQTVTTTRFHLALRKHGGPLALVYSLEPEQAPPQYQVITVTWNSTARRKVLDAGETLPFVSYAPRGISLSIR